MYKITFIHETQNYGIIFYFKLVINCTII